MQVYQNYSKQLNHIFFWFFHMIGLGMHDRTDKLAKIYASKFGVDYNVGLPGCNLKAIIHRQLERNSLDLRWMKIDTSQSIYHHNIMQEVPHMYGFTNRIRRRPVIVVRLEFAPLVDNEQTRWKPCHQTFSHTLQHYVLLYCKITEFRDNSDHYIAGYL